jgi:excisionase family DNA binding protein
MEQLYTTKSLAALLQVSQSTIRREIGEGRISWFKVRGQIRFRESDVQKYLSKRHLTRKHLQSAEIVYLPVNGRRRVAD